jgi:opacity protein-like surface antigen
MNILEEETKKEEQNTKNYIAESFKTTLVANGQSLETNSKNVLLFRISHRFGKINSGLYDLFGMDNAQIKFAFDYGLNDWLQIGVSRSSFEKLYEGNIKARILRQQTGKRNIPISIIYFTSMSINTLRWQDPLRDNKTTSRISYVHQLIIGRKFNESFTFQITPSLVHRNLVPTKNDANDVFAMGAGFRQKITKRISINAEYFHRFDNYNTSALFNPITLGFDIETGGHVFQLVFTNAKSMVEKGFIAETTGNIGKGDIYFGFNLARVFDFGTRVKKP